MTAAHKAICGGGLCAAILLFLFPPWQQGYKSLTIPYRKGIGRSFILKKPSPVEVRSVGATVDPPSAFLKWLPQAVDLVNSPESFTP
jgi:hypothetical protein